MELITTCAACAETHTTRAEKDTKLFRIALVLSVICDYYLHHQIIGSLVGRIGFAGS